MQKPIVIKVGTNIITGLDKKINTAAIADLVQQIAALKKQGWGVVLVTSGAMGAGRGRVKLITKPEPITERQVFAAVGQVPLMSTYEKYFVEAEITMAQVLATREDFRDREHYLNMQRCFTALLENNVVPVVNENDVVAAAELMFTDNDELSGLVAGMVNAEKLFLLTSVDGVLDTGGKTVPVVTKETNVKQFIRPDKTSFGRGGMQTKLQVAERLARLGVTTYIINGTRPGSVLSAVAGKIFGTAYSPTGSAPAVKKWLAQSRGIERGAITLNAGAANAVTDTSKSASILPVGVMAITGEFKKGDIIKILNEKEALLGYGRSEYSSGDGKKIIGKKNQKEFVHYNYLFLEV